MNPIDRLIDIGPLSLHVREWAGEKQAFVLLHGLSSNCRTWEMVARELALAGHRVVTVDQRGHGLSHKPHDGYDFVTVCDDLARLLTTMALERPIVVGQSWGGNVVLRFGVSYPGVAAGLGFVDGGFIDLQMRQNPTWEDVSQELKPPNLAGLPRNVLAQRLRAAHPDWSDEGIEATLANFETLPDGTIRRCLSIPHHMAILHALWQQRPQALYPQLQEPVLITVAYRGDKKSAWQSKQVEAAERGLPQVKVHWFADTDHDIHVHRPNALANLMLESLQHGIWHRNRN